MSSDNEDRRVKKLFNIPIECQKPNIGSLQMSTDLRSRLQNFLSEAEKTPMPENAENKKLIEFVENEPTEVDSSDDSTCKRKDYYVMSISKLQEEFVELQKEIGAFQELLNSAIDESEVSLEVIQHSIKSNIWELKVRLDDIALAIAQEKKNAKRKCELRQITENFFRMASEIEGKVEKAGEVEDNENSTLEELDEAHIILMNIEKNDLPKLQSEFSKLPTTESEDNIRNKAFEKQMKIIEDLKNVQSSLLNKIEANNFFNGLVILFNETVSIVSERLESARCDVNEIVNVKNNDLLAISKVISDMREVVKETGISKSDLIQECEEKFKKMTKNVDLKLADAEKKVINTITKRLEGPFKDLDFDSIERDINVLPHQSSAYTDLKNKIDGAKAKLELQKKTKDELEIIVTALKEISMSPKKSLPINEHILTFKKKLNDLTEYLKPKTDSFIPTGDADIDKDIKKQKEKVDETIEKIKKELEAKEFEKTTTDLVYKTINNIGELLSDSEKQLTNSDLFHSKEFFSTLKIKILEKLDELKTLNKKLVNGNLKEIIRNNITIINEALKNTDAVLSGIEKCEKHNSELQKKLNEVESSADRAIEIANELIECYASSPQPFEKATVDIKTINSLILEINELVEINSQIANNLGNNNFDNSLFTKKLNNYSSVVKNLEELKLKVEKDISREANLIKMRTHLQATLNQIVEKAGILINKVNSI
uniref:DUF5741 domain-containing protein n=1 Tax=Strongyloides stercoralis TaxID=6248 RepID=A0A0K0DVH0_STRER